MVSVGKAMTNFVAAAVAVVLFVADASRVWLFFIIVGAVAGVVRVVFSMFLSDSASSLFFVQDLGLLEFNTSSDKALIVFN